LDAGCAPSTTPARPPAADCVSHLPTTYERYRPSPASMRLPMRHAGQTGRHALYVYGPKRRLGAQSSFQLVFGPLDHVLDLFIALRDLGDHHGVDRLVVDLRAHV